jgi:hypothetical protein
MILHIHSIFSFFFLLVSILLFIMACLKPKQGKRGKKGSLGFVGPVGPAGPEGLEGPTGPTGTVNNALTLENVTFSNTVTTVLDPTISVSSITTYDYNALNKGTLADPSQSNLTKSLILSNDVVAPVEIQTSRGSILLSNFSVSETELIFTNFHWQSLNSSELIWFPTTQQGTKLLTNDATGTQGKSIALSADGNTLVVGVPEDESDTGATVVFVRSGSSTWTQQGPKLVGTSFVGQSSQGTRVAVSADGNTIAVGGPSDDSNVGAVWIFVRSGSTWTQQGGKLVGSNAIGFSRQGTGLDLSADGNTLAVGGPNDNSNVGATWIFTRSAGTWTEQTELAGPFAIGAAQQGSSVSLSADGNTLAVGGPADDSNVGATWVFLRSSGVFGWSAQTKLVGLGAVGGSLQGTSVSLSASGDVLAVGGKNDSSSVGACWVFVRSVSTWTQPTSKLVGTGFIGLTPNQGASVSLSADGNTLAVGSTGDDSKGSAFIFTRESQVWSQRKRLIGTGSTAGSQFGSALDLSADGNTLAVGAPNDSGAVGCAFVFV